MANPRVCVLHTAGTNCDKETAYAFSKAGADPEFVHINSLKGGRDHLEKYQILALSGGFSYGDDVAAGRILANELRFKLTDQLKKFLSDGKLIIGICNGFQILVKSGLLPGNDAWSQEVSLINNDSGKFEARWVHLRLPPSKCVWTKGIEQVIYLPVAHGEGKFVAEYQKTIARLRDNAQVVFEYCDSNGKHGAFPINPNGSTEHIAGICDTSGRILGLMPHPERHIESTQHPQKAHSRRDGSGDGSLIFKNGVEYARRHCS